VVVAAAVGATPGTLLLLLLLPGVARVAHPGSRLALPARALKLLLLLRVGALGAGAAAAAGATVAAAATVAARDGLPAALGCLRVSSREQFGSGEVVAPLPLRTGRESHFLVCRPGVVVRARVNGFAGEILLLPTPVAIGEKRGRTTFTLVHKDCILNQLLEAVPVLPSSGA